MTFRAGFVGIVGEPNAGKSTLLNRFLNEDLSIVTDKPQTTRKRQSGIVNLENGQIVFLDAPGFIRAKSGLNEFLMKEAKQVLADVDVLLVVISVDTERREQAEEVLNLVSKSQGKKIVIITKTDIEKYLPRRTAIQKMVAEKMPGVPILEMSSKSSKIDIQDVLVKIWEYLPASEAPLYDEDIMCLEAERVIVAEKIREQCLEMLHQEIPYKIAVMIRQFLEEEKIVRIDADIIVGKESHKSIVVGKKGSMIKKIGTESRAKVEKFLNKKVMLKLQVVVRENWDENPNFMKELGYVIEETK